MKKSDIEYHSDGFGRRSRPAINVKCRNWPQAHKIAEKLGCTEAQAEHASELAWQSACQSFWDDAQDLADHYLKDGRVYSEGRCAGWLVVDGLGDVESWDAIMVSRWARFAKSVADDIKYRSSLEQVCESIEANEWHKDGSELYNFVERKDGIVACIADMKRDAIAAGFGPVVRAERDVMTQ